MSQHLLILRVFFLLSILTACGDNNTSVVEKAPVRSETETENAPKYVSVEIAGMEWMAENLNVTTFRNGETIPQATSIKELEAYGESGLPAWCYPGFSASKGQQYGLCYNWFAVNDPRGLAPEGWRIPTPQDWDRLAASLGGTDLAGLALKSTTGWQGQAQGNNSSGFTALASGAMSVLKGYAAEERVAVFWTSSPTEGKPSFAEYRVIHGSRSGIFSEDDIKMNALSVRCIRE